MGGIITSKVVIAALLKAYKRDRKNRYRLNTPWRLPRLLRPVPDYHGKRVEIVDSTITILPYPDCDGATLTPDKIGDWSLIEGALGHDALYLELEAIAQAWGWTVAQVRSWVDDVFYGIALRHAPNWVARAYWHGVRACGGIAHAVGRLLMIVVLAGTVAGCGGCRTPVDPFEPGPMDKPDYTKTA